MDVGAQVAADIAAEKAELIEQIKALAIVRGKVTLSSGRTADYYVDMRRVTLDGAVAPVIGRVMRALVADWDFEAVGGLTLGADPVATAMMHAAATAGDRLDAFVVRKEGKAHGLQQRIEGPSVAGRRVLAVEDTSTTGASVLTAVEALSDAAAQVIGVAVVVDRNTGAREAVAAAGLPYRAAISAHDLGLE
jgi:orotate phosphoribosyltransferase